MLFDRINSMGETIRNLLITGKPGVGKTTVIKKLAGELADLRPRGFYTEEIRKAGKRKGLEGGFYRLLTVLYTPFMIKYPTII